MDPWLALPSIRCGSTVLQGGLEVKKLWILVTAAAVLGALPSAAQAQFIGTDGFYNMSKTSGNTFISIIGQAGTTLLGVGDDSSFTFNLAAPFSYYTTPYTTGSVSTNGLITFGGAVNNAFTNSALTATNPPNPSIAPYWDDLRSDLVAGQGVYAQVTGNVTTLEWLTAYFGQTGPTAAFQVVFNSTTGTITFNYGDISTGGTQANAGSATVGITHGTGLPPGSFIQAGFNVAGTVVSNDSVLITQAVPEPGSMMLCGVAAVGGFGFIRSRRRKAS